jgi:membrane protein implicated in regulation of membrane protease activity
MDFLPWVWALLALLFLVIEIFTLGFFMLCFGLGAGAAAILAFYGYGFTVQMGAFVVVSALAVVTARPLALSISGKTANTVGIDRVLHKRGVVIIDIDPIIAKGRVRVDREEWLADSVTGQPIPAGVFVEVLGVEGTHLQVRPGFESKALEQPELKDYSLQTNRRQEAAFILKGDPHDR